MDVEPHMPNACRSAATVVLGFSGLSLARTFKRAMFPELTEREHHITQGADAAAALVVDGQLVAAAAEERFDGRKHSAAFPKGAAEYCLSEAGATWSNVDFVAHSFAFATEQAFYSEQSDYYRTYFDKVLHPDVNRGVVERWCGANCSGKFVSVPHHLAHAESAFVPSEFEDALVVVSDGLGERHSATVYRGGPQGLETIASLPATASVGLLYGLFTVFLGFEFGDGEYKVMGLAPYGDRERYGPMILDRWLSLSGDGRYFAPLLLANATDLDKESFRAALEAMELALGPRRLPGAPIEQRHKDIAAGVQSALEAAQLHLLGYFRKQTGLKRLCLAGGVALNCVANGLILRSRLFSEIFVQPASGDDGAALGAALHAARLAGGRVSVPRGSSFGPEYDTEAFRDAVRAIPDALIETFATDEDLVKAVARAIRGGSVVGWFQGRMEFGPRALGNRSILADPTRTDMRERINALVKKREGFRPFAPAVPAEDASKIFEIEPADLRSYETMLFVTHLRQEFDGALPATTHVDGSARVQVVHRDPAPLFWSLLREFGALTGLPVLLNTSFNVAGQPIVRTPEQAVETAFDAGLDLLVIDRNIVSLAVRTE
jgi:carbamoyltransferase